MDFIELAKKRYSVRSYSEKKVEQEKLNQILQAALPDNLEPINILVVGYSNETPVDAERHSQTRIPLNKLVSYETL